MEKAFIRFFNALTFILWLIVLVIVVVVALVAVGVVLGVHVPTM